MEKIIKLGDIVSLSLGKNITRMDVEDSLIYSLDDFDTDLYGSDEKTVQRNVTDEKALCTGDCIVSLTRSQAVIVSEHSNGKYISSNFVKCIFLSEDIDPWYFCYLINEDTDIAKQIKKMQQASNGFVSKLSIASISDLLVVLPSLDKQKNIGRLYKEVLIQESLRKKQLDNWKQLNMEMLKMLNKKH